MLIWHVCISMCAYYKGLTRTVQLVNREEGNVKKHFFRQHFLGATLAIFFCTSPKVQLEWVSDMWSKVQWNSTHSATLTWLSRGGSASQHTAEAQQDQTYAWWTTENLELFPLWPHRIKTTRTNEAWNLNRSSFFFKKKAQSVYLLATEYHGQYWRSIGREPLPDRFHD